MRITVKIPLSSLDKASVESNRVRMILLRLQTGLEPQLEQDLLEAARFMKMQAVNRVHVVTGSLQKSIRIEHQSKRKVAVRAGGYVMNPKTGKLVNYAAYEEALHPFMAPSFEEVKPFIENKIRESMERLAR